MEMTKSYKRKCLKQDSESIVCRKRKKVCDYPLDDYGSCIAPDKKMIVGKEIKAKNNFSFVLPHGNLDRVTQSTELTRKQNMNHLANSGEDNIEKSLCYLFSGKTKDIAGTERNLSVMSVNRRRITRSNAKLLAAEEWIEPLQEMTSISVVHEMQISEDTGIPFETAKTKGIEHSLPVLSTSSNMTTDITSQCTVPLQKMMSLDCLNKMQNVSFLVLPTNEANTKNRQSTKDEEKSMSHKKLNENNITDITVNNTLSLKNQEIRELNEKNKKIGNEFEKYKEMVLQQIQELQEKVEDRDRLLQFLNEENMKEKQKLYDALEFKNEENTKLRERNEELEDWLNKYKNDIQKLQEEKEEQNKSYLLEINQLSEELNLENTENRKLREQNQELENKHQKYKEGVEMLLKEKEAASKETLTTRIKTYDFRLYNLEKQIKDLESQIIEKDNTIKKYTSCYEMVYGSEDMKEFGSLVLRALETEDWNPPSSRLKEIKLPYLVLGEFTRAVNLSSTRVDEHILVTAAKKKLNLFVSLLVYAGFPVNHQFTCRNNGTLLHVAAAENNAVLANFLLKYGADINMKDGQGFTPLHKAVKHRCHEATQCLINNGADVHAQTEEGWTSLHLSVKRGNVALISLLLDAGCSKNAKNKRDEKPYDVAMRFGRDPEILSHLVPNNENPNNEDPNNEVPNNEVPNNEVPNNEVPNNEVPNNEDPNNEVPNNEDPNNEDPNNEVPNNENPNNEDPNNEH